MKVHRLVRYLMEVTFGGEGRIRDYGSLVNYSQVSHP